LASSANRLTTANDSPSFSDDVATNEGVVSLVNTHSEHSPADSQTDDNNNHDRHLSTTTIDMHSDLRVVIPIISDSEDDSANQSPQPHLQHPPIIPITTDSKEVSESESVKPFPQPRRNPTHHRAPPTKLQDFVTYAARHPISNYFTYQHLLTEHTAFLSYL
jgi:hypothetical protein